MLKLILLSIFVPCLNFALANDKSSLGKPHSFETPDGKAVFVDFLTADYNIEYDLKAKEAKVTTTIKFKNDEKGLPIFDSISSPSSIQLDGVQVTETLTPTPDKATDVRVIKDNLSPGIHTMTIKTVMDQKYLDPLLEMKGEKVKNLFHFTDGDDREFLELFMPANFEYDQVKMNFNVSFKNSHEKHQVFSNGTVTQHDDGSFQISYPDNYTTSSIFFHVIPEESVRELRFEMKSVDGRNIPSVVYYLNSNELGTEEMLKKAVEISTQTLEELEDNFGTYPHDAFIVYNEGGGMSDDGSGPGMEFCGAMIIAGLNPLRHEIIHSYFGRGVMPANGNAGWIDEAITTWAENGYSKRYDMDDYKNPEGLATQSEYTRHHHDGGYDQGAEFIAYLNGKLESRGGIKPFLKDLIKNKAHQTITTEEFQKRLNDFYGLNFDNDFDKYVYARKKKPGEKLPPDK